MKDIDFDELDKAVSAVLAPAKKRAPVTAKPAVDGTSATETAAADDGQKVIVTSSATLAKKEDDNTNNVGAQTEKAATDDAKTNDGSAERAEDTQEKPAAPAAIIKRAKSGAFMDMVHPSSRMVAQSNVKPMPQPAHRAMTVSPSTVPAGDIKTDAKLGVGSGPESTAHAQPESVEPSTSPLDFHGFKYDGNEAPHSNGAVSTDTTETPAATTTEKDEPYVPPFVTGAKVEKRPLGAFSEASSSENNDTAARSSDERIEPVEQAAEVEPTAVSQVNVSAHPREYDEDILSVESDHTATESATTLPASPVVASIPQQYSVKQAIHPQDGSPHSLFDTTEYHPPIAAHASEAHHHHLGTWVAVATILLVATAIAYGYWVYTGVN